MTATQPRPITWDAVKPGEWIPTGWGAQHLVREVTDTHLILACHGPGLEQRAKRDDVKLNAAQEDRCAACERAGGPRGLGPAPRGAIGEIRRTPEGWIAVKVSHAYQGWIFVGAHPEGSYGRAPDWFMGNAERIGAIPGTPAA
ncbi:hypothetical protein [Nocardia altamirensis]|uniref:hypothetical protein n=1 Tax=Nocardia altamirensis TaxID=472158 RepID=UPI00083FE632|nr:hypothetical protein [Nocardia altamirensis]